MTPECPRCHVPLEMSGGKVSVACPSCREGITVRTYVPPTQPQSKGIPLKGKTKILWFTIGVACWLAFVIYAQFQLAAAIMAMPSIIIIILVGQHKQATLESGVRNAWVWMGYLWWIMTGFIAALQFSIPYLFLFYGLLMLGGPFIVLGFAFWVQQRLRRRSATIDLGSPFSSETAKQKV